MRDLKGKAVILAFYPADWSPVCGDQMAVYNEILPEFRHHNAELLGISVDSALNPQVKPVDDEVRRQHARSVQDRPFKSWSGDAT